MKTLSEKRKELLETMNLVMPKGVAKDIYDRIIFQDKQFIKNLKEEITPKSSTKKFQEEFIWCPKDLNKVINKLAGKELVE